MGGPRSIAKLVNITPRKTIGLWYAKSELYWGESKPTNITGGGAHCNITIDTISLGFLIFSPMKKKFRRDVCHQEEKFQRVLRSGQVPGRKGRHARATKRAGDRAAQQKYISYGCRISDWKTCLHIYTLW